MREFGPNVSSRVSNLAADRLAGLILHKHRRALGRCGRAHRTTLPLRRQTPAAGSGDCSSHLGQRQLAPELLQMRGHDCPSEGLRPLWRVEPDLERDRDSRQHATQYEYLDHRHCPWPCGLDESELMTQCPANSAGCSDQGNRRGVAYRPDQVEWSQRFDGPRRREAAGRVWHLIGPMTGFDDQNCAKCSENLSDRIRSAFRILFVQIRQIRSAHATWIMCDG